MHIPACKTSDISLDRFEDALKHSEQPCDTYDVNHWIYVPKLYSEYRYILGTRGEKPLICVGINPSTAEPDKLDNTVKSVERIAFCNGFDSFIMFNVYAQRATVPDDMEKTFNKKLHAENMKAFDYILSLYNKDKPSIWAAWGTLIEKRAYLAECMQDMIALGEKYSANWYTAGKCSLKGHPHHPLYLQKNSPLTAFDASCYCRSVLYNNKEPLYE